MIDSVGYWKPVIIESPFAGADEKENIEYARACMRECLLRGEAPFASHLIYTQVGVLDDHDPEERRCGINAGLAIGRALNATSVVYLDRGLSRGMMQGIERAALSGRSVEYRLLDGPSLTSTTVTVSWRKLVEFRDVIQSDPRACLVLHDSPWTGCQYLDYAVSAEEA